MSFNKWQSSRLTYEEVGLNHASELFSALNSYEVGQYIGGPDSESLDQLIEKIKFVTDKSRWPTGQIWHNFVVKLDNKVIGRIEATEVGNAAEIAYLIGLPWWGNGYGLEAANWLLDFLRIRKLDKVWATVDPENTASIKLLENLDFKKVTDVTGIELLSYEKGDLVYSRDIKSI